jgi:AbrB family looped-hinge helix DNA binding protein
MPSTLSSRFRVTIPKAIREELRLEAGQRFTVIAKERIIALVPVRSFADARGMLRGANPNGYRERSTALPSGPKPGAADDRFADRESATFFPEE